MKLTGRIKGRNILYRSDCKEAIQNLREKEVFVDLIYLDPPFNSNRVYNIIYKGKGSKAQQKAFHDTWDYTYETQQMLEGFEKYLANDKEISEVVKKFLKIWIQSLSQMSSKDKSMVAYLIYMSERLILMKKILKDTGSIYYHCDPTASHYIKVIMDGIFGSENFKNEIIWCYSSPSNTQKWFPRKHDVILFYTKSNKKWFFDNEKIKVPYIKLNTGSSRHGIFKQDALLNEKGKNVEDWWTGITPVGRLKNERLGYTTQKPLALLERIIKASCPSKGIVLDPFCGCGTTVAAANNLGLKWIGIDISLNAMSIIKDRLSSAKFFEVDGDPESRNEYDKLDPFKKQEFLINKVGGYCNKKKTGDGGVDGEITIHLGEEKGKDKWGKMIISVKTGKQCKPEFIRELMGTVKDKKADIGGLILEADPSDNMVELAERQGKLKYSFNESLPPQEFDKIQILTAGEIIDKKKFDIPHTIQEIQFYRKEPDLPI